MRASANATAAVIATAICAGCGGDPEPRERAAGSRTDAARVETSRDGAGTLRGGPPDAGTRGGHGADPRQVRVPRRDASPPAARIVLAGPGGAALAEAAMPGPAHEGVATLAAPRVDATAIGEDADGGVARVRVSLMEAVECVPRRGRGAPVRRLRRRYFPPPQVERVRSAPGTPLPVVRRRTRSVELARERCPRGARASAVRGELWAEAVNGSGLEAVTPHVRFRWARGGAGAQGG